MIPPAHPAPRRTNDAPRTTHWLRNWWPAMLWAASIFVFSTGLFSAANTASIIFPILSWLFPRASEAALDAAHFYIRKSAHLSEYFLLSLLVLRGFRAGRPGWCWSWALATLAVVAAYASLDEFHQSFVPSRTASIYDVMIDVAGATLALAAAALWAACKPRISPPIHTTQ